MSSGALRGQYPPGTSIEDFDLDFSDKKRKYQYTDDSDDNTSDDERGHIPKSQWTVQDSDELYHITRGWGFPYFTTNDDGHIVAQAPGKKGIDLYTTVQDLVARGHNLPLIIRFKDILKDRVHLLNEAFRKAIHEYDYSGDYRGVFPVKVCQQRQVVSEIVEHGAIYKYGLEAGSKPELLIVLAQLTTPGALITCNGYKDSDYLETALLAQRLGQTPIIIIEKLHEIDLVLTASKKLGIRPIVGARAKLSARGIGRWSDSSGVKSKFGLSAADIMIMVNKLKEVGMLDCLQLLHFHIGSQISNISAIKNALREACQYYVQLSKLGANMKYIDVGGGLGIDYDGSKTAFHASINYTEEEYAADVVVAVKDTCTKHSLPCPTIISESGRAISSHHSLLVFNVLSSTNLIEKQPDSIAGLFSTSSNVYKPLKTDHDLAVKMYDVLMNIGSHNLQHSLHKARQHKEESVQLFSLGLLSLPDLAKCEELYWCCMNDIDTFSQELDFVPAEIKELKQILSQCMYVNLSIAQSAIDCLAIDQLFPIAPIHRLDEKPTISAQLADVTSDSDGRIATFINTSYSGGDTRSTLDLHKLEPNSPYYLGMFLSGAYQEVLGCLYNLYGDTNIVHLDLDEEDPNGYDITQVIPGDTIDQVLKYCYYDTKSFLDSIRGQAERALRTKELSLQQYKTLVKHFEHSLSQYTYLTSDK
jgi:arginine decarboxylase